MFPIHFYCRRIFVTSILVLVMVGTIQAESSHLDSAPFSMNTMEPTPAEDLALVPQVNFLSPCHPNPFNPRTTIEFHLSQSGDVHLAIYDLRGQLVRTLQSGEFLPVGYHDAVWDGRNSAGQSVAGGVYLCRMKVADFAASQRMTLIK
jgi:hypothetical protein